MLQKVIENNTKIDFIMYFKTATIRNSEVIKKVYKRQENLNEAAKNLEIIEGQQKLFFEIGIKIGGLEKLVIISRDKCFISESLRKELETAVKIKQRNQNSNVTTYVVHPQNFNEDLFVNMKKSQKIMKTST